MALSSDANKCIVRAYLDEVFNAHVPERASDYLTPDVKWHGGTLGTVQGVENVVGLLRGFTGALPNLRASTTSWRRATWSQSASPSRATIGESAWDPGHRPASPLGRR